MLFSATTTAATLLDEVIADMGLYEEFDRAFYRTVLNECIARLYGDILRPAGCVAVCPDAGGRVLFAALPTPAGEAPLRPADLRGIEGDEHPYLAVTPSVFARLTGAYVYCVTDGAILLSPPRGPVRLIYTARPPAYTADTEHTPLPIPEEYVSLLRAKLRGEAYKLANEEALAAKWLGEYNQTLAAFSAAVEEEKWPTQP